MTATVRKLETQADPQRQARIDLAAAHRLAHRLGYDDGIWNHFTLTVPALTYVLLVRSRRWPVPTVALAFLIGCGVASLTLPAERTDPGQLKALKEPLEGHPGPCPVTLEVFHRARWTVSMGATGHSVEPSEAFLSSLERLFGEKVCELR